MKKLLLVILSCLLTTATTLMFTSCKTENITAPTVEIGENGNWFIDGVDTGLTAKGEQGVQGEKGDKGDTGAQGEQGVKGDKGDSGNDGKSPVITIGANGNWFIDGADTGVLAKGDKGDQGLRGEKGDKGDTGEQGEQGIQGGKGEQGVKGDKGDDGAAGKSAYEIACDNGFEGTLDEWLASLVGKDGSAVAKGDKGDRGEQGIQGEKGDKGDQGEQGVQGEKGDKGDQGEQGIQGEKGDKGNRGEQGIQGEKGDKGDQGEQGIQGEKGDKGDQGEQGIQGEKGDKGDQGEQGIQGEKGDKGDQGEQGIQGEKGDKGDQGEQGIQGEKGDKGSDGVSIVNAYVDENLHLWLELSDGTKIDAGYVGVTSAPTKTYTVIFKDYDGSELKRETVESGKSATAPAAPVRDGYVFSGWDKKFDNITDNTVITATYTKNSDLPALAVGSATAATGETKVIIAVSLKNNPGFLTMALNIAYDSNVLTLTKVSNGSDYSDYNFTAPKDKSSGCTAAWFATDLPEEILDGDVLLLQFTVSAEATSGDYFVTVTCPDDGSTLDGDKNEITIAKATGYITVA